MIIGLDGIQVVAQTIPYHQSTVNNLDIKTNASPDPHTGTRLSCKILLEITTR